MTGPYFAPSERRTLVLLLGAALVLLLGLQAIEPRFFLRDDNATQYLPGFEYAYETVASGEVPLLNQHQMFGGTFLATGHMGVFLATLYPARVALGILGADPVYLIDVLATLHFGLAAIGMLLLLRHLGLRPALALPLALCWTFLPFGIITSRTWIVVSLLIAYLPWNQWALERWLAAPSSSRWLQLVAVKALFYLAGYYHYMILATFFEGVYLLPRLLLAGGGASRMARQAARIGGAYVLAGLLAAPLLLPGWRAKEVSYQRAVPIPEHVALESPLEPAAFLAANFFAATEKVCANLSTAIYFLGPLFLFGLAAAFWRLGRGAAWRSDPLPAAALLVGLFALAMSTTLYRLLMLLPVFGSLRWPFRLFPLAAFYLFLPAATALAAWAAAASARGRIGAGLAWLNLGLQLLVLAPPTWRAPNGPWVLDRTVAELRRSPLVERIGRDGRVALIGSEADPGTRGKAVELGFLYATLADRYHVHGYDPLRAKINAEIGFRGVDNSALMQLFDGAWPTVFPRLPRYLILSATSKIRPLAEATPGVRRLVADEGLVLLENSQALPLVGWTETQRPLPFRWRTNGLELDLPADWSGGHLLFDVAGIAGYRVFLNGEDLGPPELLSKRPLVQLPPGPGRVELRYVDRFFQLGLALAALGLLVVLMVRRRGSGAPAGAGEGQA